MKNKILATLVAFGLVGSVSAIEINDNLSVNGFIDGSINKYDSATAGADTSNWGLDEVEVNFLLNVGSASGTIALESQDIGTAGADLDIEQAHFTYSLDNGISLTLGKYGSAMGLEREDPSGLYTYSRAYSVGATGSAFNIGDVTNNSVEGLIVAYAAEAWTAQISIDNPTGTIRTASTAKDDLDYEVALSYTGVENLNLGLGFRAENALNSSSVKVDNDTFNVNATYTIGKALIGAEYTETELNNVDYDAMLILVDYDVSDKLGVAVRYSDWESIGATTDLQKITIAPNYAITESLGAILEYSDVNDDSSGDSDEIALELTYTF
jgi:hypothetical protein